MKSHRYVRGLTMIELLIAIAVAALTISMLVMGIQTVASAFLRSAQNRADYDAANTLTQEMQRSADSSVALFTPSPDALGNSVTPGNSGTSIGFASKDGQGNYHFWQYVYDSTNNTVQRYTYTWGNTPVADGNPWKDVTSFQVDRIPTTQLKELFLNGYTPASYELSTGFPGVNMGNTVTRVTMTVGPIQWRTVRLLPASIPSGFNEIVSGGGVTLPGSYSMTIIAVTGGSGHQPPPIGHLPPACPAWACDTPFNWNELCQDQGMWIYSACGGPDGAPPGKSSSSGSTTTYTGSISFSGTFDGNWNNFASQNPVVQCGNSYSYNETAGGAILVTFNCSGAPPFVPIPVSGGGPSGPVTFHAQ